MQTSKLRVQVVQKHVTRVPPSRHAMQGLVDWISGLDSGLDQSRAHTPFSIFPKRGVGTRLGLDWTIKNHFMRFTCLQAWCIIFYSKTGFFLHRTVQANNFSDDTKQPMASLSKWGKSSKIVREQHPMLLHFSYLPGNFFNTESGSVDEARKKKITCIGLLTQCIQYGIMV